MMRFYPGLILLWLCAVLISCGGGSSGRPSQAEEKLFVETYVRLAQAAEDHRDHPEDLEKAREAVFEQLGWDEQRFDAVAQKLEKSPQRWVFIWEQIVERLKEAAETGG